MISVIAAMALGRVIGAGNKMPWHLPADLKHFKVITMGKPIVMGRKTFESIGKPLPGRRNVVLTRQAVDYTGCEVWSNLDEALAELEGEPEIMVIGGASLYEQVLPKASRMYLTYIECDVEGDTFFPAWDEREWKMVSCETHRADNVNPYNYQFLVLERF